MPNPKLETYKNKATNTVYDLTDADAQSKLTSILDGTNIDSFGDVETAVAALQPKNLSHSIAGESTVEGALDAIAAGSGVTVDDAMSSSSTNPVQNKVITSALAGKQDTLTFDNFPTAGSNNPVKSGGVKSATTEIWGVIGPIEAGITSAHAYEVGDHFECYYGYVTVIAPIAVGDTIENNVNVVGGTIASTMTQDAKDAFPRDEQAVLGSRNFFNYEAWKSVQVINGTAVFENNGVTLTATSNDCYTANTDGDYPLGARIPVKTGQTIKLRWKSSATTYKGAVYIFDSAGNYQWVQNQTEEFVYTPINDEYIVPRFGVTTNGDTLSYSNIMVTLATDDYPSYSDFAMTNSELTEFVNNGTEVDLTSSVNTTNFTVGTGGSVKYVKKGNTCTVTINNVTPASTGNNKALLSGANIPRALMQTYGVAVAGNGDVVGMISIPTNYMALNIKATSTIYSSITYIMA